MQRYAGIITQYLSEKGIPYEENRKERSINMVFESDCGNTFSIFHYDDAQIMSWSILSWRIPGSRVAKVTDLLREINVRLKWGMFYLDEPTGCVTYALIHIPGKQSGVINEKLLLQFCSNAISMVSLYRDAICKVAFEDRMGN